MLVASTAQLRLQPLADWPKLVVLHGCAQPEQAQAVSERSIDVGTQWVVFEPNNERLWANVRRTIEDFLLVLWRDGMLLGEKPEQAFFVRCDRTTMTQNDLDNGRLICLIGVAPVKPAEFVIFRIGQWTGDAAAAA